MSVCLSIYLSIYLSTYLSIYLSIYVSHGRISTNNLICICIYKSSKIFCVLCLPSFLHPTAPRYWACMFLDPGLACVLKWETTQLARNCFLFAPDGCFYLGRIIRKAGPHRIIEWLGLEGTSKLIKLQPSTTGRTTNLPIEY